jgi:hypothetical protein
VADIALVCVLGHGLKQKRKENYAGSVDLSNIQATV